MMKMNFRSLIVLGLGFATMIACNKEEYPEVSQPLRKVGESVQAGNVSGSVKGTMMSGETYTLNGLVTVNEGDTLLIQEGATVYVSAGACLEVKGVFLSIGSREKPIWITVKDAVKQDNLQADINTDPAYKGIWSGIYCRPTCNLCVVKWTHIEYVGTQYQELTGNIGGNPRVIYFNCPDGYLVFEDNWVYGVTNDVIRFEGGYFNIMRNTIEKCGPVSGDIFNVKGASKGNIAYNLYASCATTGSKGSNAGNSGTFQCELATFNNTFLNGGWRRVSAGGGGSVNYEEGAKGLIYNNLIVNCRYGIRMVGAPAADVANTQMGHNFSYGENLEICNEFYPTGHITPVQETDIPKPSSFLPTDYQPGDVYDGTTLVKQNDPQFANYPLGNTFDNIKLMSYVGGFDFRLKSTSPVIGKGTTNFQPFFTEAGSKFPKGEFGSSEITLPSIDIGAYPTNNKGNQHF